MTELRPTPGGEGYENPEKAPVFPTPGPTEADLADLAAGKTPAGAVVEEEAAPAPAAVDYGDLESKTNAELQAMLADQGKPTYGTKAELIERLTGE